MNRIPCRTQTSPKFTDLIVVPTSLFDLCADGFSKISDKMEQIELSKVCYVINV